MGDLRFVDLDTGAPPDISQREIGKAQKASGRKKKTAD